MPKPGAAAGRLHPVVAAYVNTNELLPTILQKADDGNDPVVHAMHCLRKGMTGQCPVEEARGLAERVFPPPKGTDRDLYAFFLTLWALLADHREGCAILNVAEAMVSEDRTPPEIRAAVIWTRSVVAEGEGVTASRQGLALISRDSPRYWAALLTYLGALAEVGRLSEAEDQCRLYDEFLREGKLPHAVGMEPQYFMNAVETGNIAEACRLEKPALEMLVDPRLANHRALIAGRSLILRLLQGQRMHEETLLPDGRQEATYVFWPAAITHLLERRPEEALRWARRMEEASPGLSFSLPAFFPLTLLRSELAAGNASAARRILEARLAKQGGHYLDALFLARIALLEGDRVAAARHFAAVRAACRRYGAEGRLDFELRMACELSPTDIMELSREPVPEQVAAGTPPAVRPADERRGVAHLVGPSRALAAVRKAIARAAPHDAPVLVTGETGTGKELVAKAIHEESPRRNEPFVAVDCGTISENLLESELFGHEKGAFTGADRPMPGLFREAGRGTILLDEIGDIGPRLQGALLRVLESGEIRPVGAGRNRKVHCRVIAATNAPLKASVDRGRFRKDLFYRLERLLVHIPPLRERKDDIAPLAVHFLSLGRGGGERATLSPALAQAFSDRPWPGNVRELRNEMERLRLFNSDKLAYDLPDLPGAGAPQDAGQQAPFADRAAGTETGVETQEPQQASQNVAEESIIASSRNPMRMTERLRELFTRHNRLTTAEVRKLLAIAGSTATSYLKALCAEGCIEKICPTRSPRSHYFRTRQISRLPEAAQISIQKTAQISPVSTTQSAAQKIMDLVMRNPRVTRQELARLVGITGDGVKYHLGALKRAGVLKRVGPDNGGHWEAIVPQEPCDRSAPGGD